MYVTIPPRTIKEYDVVVHYKYFKRLPLLITTVAIQTDSEPMRFTSKQELKHYIKNQIMNTYREYNYNACNIVITEAE